jgi:hypothetical protein
MTLEGARYQRGENVEFAQFPRSQQWAKFGFQALYILLLHVQLWFSLMLVTGSSCARLGTRYQSFLCLRMCVGQEGEKVWEGIERESKEHRARWAL